MMTELATQLRHLADYQQGTLEHSAREMLRSAAAALTPADPLRDLDTLERLLSLLADPAVTRARIAEFRVAATEADAARLNAENMVAELDQKRAAFQSELAEHQRKIGVEAGRHEAAMYAREQEVSGREIIAAELLAQAQADAAAAAELKADLQSRINAVQKLAAA